MKPVKNLLLATLLTSVFAVSVFAGDQGTPGAPAPPPDPARITSTEETPTDTSTDTQQTTVESLDYIIFETLAALLSLY